MKLYNIYQNIAFFVLIGITTISLNACQPKPDNAVATKNSYQKITGQTMGTSYHITFEAPQIPIDTIQADIDKRLLEINKSMSTYDDTATIMAFNRAKAGEVIVIDSDFQQVLKDSYTIYKQSHGAFDPTIMPLVNLWGFGAKFTIERLQSPPSQDDINQAKALIGLDKVIFQDNTISKTVDGVGLDFSAIAKGYGVDVIADVLKNQYQINNYLVEIGGEVAALGVNDQGKPWRIAIDAPILGSQVSDRKIATTLSLNNQHIATSGNYRNSIEYNGIRYSHTINPATAHPVINGADSVTVIHDSTALADGWATALTAIAYNDAYQLAEQANIAALFIQKDDDKDTWQMTKTTAMQKLYPKN